MIDKLEFLLAVARERHFGRAAEACGVAQPTLSGGIKHLEEALGVILIRRGSRFLGFTSEGERVLEWARRIVSDVRALKHDVESLKHGLTGHLRIAAIPTALPVIAALTEPFHARYPKVRYSILSRSSEQISELLANLEIDIGITYLDNEPLGRVSTIPLYQEKYCVFVSQDSALAGKSAVTWADVANIPLCLLTPDMQNRRIIDLNLAQSGVAPSTTLESDSLVVLFTHILTGQWASIMPEVMTRMFDLTDKLTSIPIMDTDAIYTVGLIAGPREPLSPLVSAIMIEARRASTIPTK